MQISSSVSLIFLKINFLNLHFYLVRLFCVALSSLKLFGYLIFYRNCLHVLQALLVPPNKKKKHKTDSHNSKENAFLIAAGWKKREGECIL